MTDNAVAREIGISRWTVERRRLALGIPPFGPARRSRTAELAGAWYVKARRGGTPVSAIARKHGVSAATVRRAILRYERRLAEERPRSATRRGPRRR
jgi:hypothetical protein